MSRAVLISGGDITDYEFIKSFISDDDYIVCADRGIVHCDKMNLKADLWVGDFDSCDYDMYKDCQAAQGAEVISLPAEKDKTDTEYALDCILKLNGFQKILLLGAMGTRMDHTITNIHMLEKASDCKAVMEILNEKNRIRLSNDSGIYFKKSEFKYISIIPISKMISGITSTGLKYEMNEAMMFRNESLGVSNELARSKGSIHISNGVALIIESRD